MGLQFPNERCSEYQKVAAGCVARGEGNAVKTTQREWGLKNYAWGKGQKSKQIKK